MFKKTAVFGDLHLGKHGDSPTFNNDCLDYLEWFCLTAASHNVDKIIFLGDYFDNRSRIRLDTQDYGNRGMDMLREVAPVDVIVGNHDMFHKHSRDVHSVSCYKEWDHVTVYDTISETDNVGYVPYLVGTEYLDVLNLDVKYIFGHLELPGFLMNSSVEFPNRGQFNANGFKHPDMVFSGHFHKRQFKASKNGVPVWYIGSPFGHDFNDVDDPERGMMILEWGNDPIFIDYENGPLFQRFKVSEILDMLDDGSMTTKTRTTSILEIRDDVGIPLTELADLRDMVAEFVREVRMKETKTVVDVTESDVSDMDSKSVTDIVVEHLENIQNRGDEIDPSKLTKIFLGDDQ